MDTYMFGGEEFLNPKNFGGLILKYWKNIYPFTNLKFQVNITTHKFRAFNSFDFKVIKRTIIRDAQQKLKSFVLLFFVCDDKTFVLKKIPFSSNLGHFPRPTERLVKLFHHDLQIVSNLFLQSTVKTCVNTNTTWDEIVYF